MLLASLRLIVDDLGVERIASALHAHTQRIATAARALGFRVPPRHAPNMVGLRPSDAMPDADTIVQRLAQASLRPFLSPGRRHDTEPRSAFALPCLALPCLAQRKPKPVLVSERLGVIRIAPHVYNTADDIEALLEGLRDSIRAPARPATAPASRL